MHGMGWFSYINYNSTQSRPKISWALIRRVLGYARPFRSKIIGMLVLILVAQGISLLGPVLYGQIIDKALYKGDGGLLDRLALVIIVLPILNGGIGVWQRYLNSSVGEGVIYRLYTNLYTHLQKMSLRFFTNTKTGELMSRLNNDVVGAQSAINSPDRHLHQHYLGGHYADRDAAAGMALDAARLAGGAAVRAAPPAASPTCCATSCVSRWT